MIIFTPRSHDYVADMIGGVTGFSRGSYTTGRYKNGEMNLHVATPVAGKPCLIIGTIGPPDENFLEILVLAHTLKKEGATQVHALFPYLAYMRHDKTVPTLDLATQCIGRLLQAAGIGRITTIDLHSARSEALVAVPITALSLAELWADTIHDLGYEDAVVVAPDNGAIGRCIEVSRLLPGQRSIAHFEKHRTEEGVEIRALLGFVGARAVIVDDMIDSGETLLCACEQLKRQGTTDILILVAHGLFSGDAWLGLFNLGVNKIVCTNSVRAADLLPQHPQIKVVSIDHVLRSHIHQL